MPTKFYSCNSLMIKSHSGAAKLEGRFFGFINPCFSLISPIRRMGIIMGMGMEEEEVKEVEVKEVKVKSQG